MPNWVPVVFGVITPFCFSTQVMLVKHLCGPKVGFNAQTLSFSCFSLVNFIILMVSIGLWTSDTLVFHPRYYLIGILGSLSSTCGVVTANVSVKYGPGGPSTALINVSSILLLI